MVKCSSENAWNRVSLDFFAEVVDFIFHHESFIRDETLPEKILGALKQIDDSRLKDLFTPLEAGLRRCLENLDSYSQAIQSLALRLSSVALKITTSVISLLRAIRYHELTTASKSAYVSACSSVVTLYPLEETSWIPVPSMICDVMASNVYLRREIGDFISVANRQNEVLFSTVLRLCEKENKLFWNKLLCNSPLDLLAPNMRHIVEKEISSSYVDPLLIVKHPELLQLVPLDDVFSELQSPAYFEVLSMYGAHFKGSYDSVILNRFLFHLSRPASPEEMLLKSQLVDPFCTFINGLDDNSAAGSLIQSLFECLTEVEVEPLFLRLRMLRCLSDKFAKEVQNETLLHMFSIAFRECDAKSLLLVMDFLFTRNFDRLHETWEKQYAVKTSSNLFSLGNQTTSIKMSIKEAVISSNWDIRDATCCAIDLFLENHISLIDSNILRDFEEMIVQLMNDTNHYVLCSVLKLLPKFYGRKCSMMKDSDLVNFLEHCSTFCEDSIHSRLTNLLKSYPQFCDLASTDSLLRRTFESDLCSYKTKGEAVNVMVKIRNKNHVDDDRVVFPDWLSKFMNDENSDQLLVQEVYFAVGLKERLHLTDSMYAELQLKAVCEEIMAESITSNVPLDCY